MRGRRVRSLGLAAHSCVRTCGGQSAEVAGASCDDFQVVSVPGPEERGHAELGRNRCNGAASSAQTAGSRLVEPGESSRG